MSGKFTHFYSDPIAYDEKVKRSTGPLNYNLDPNYAINNAKCFAPYGPRAGQQASDVIGQQIDVESFLKGVDRIKTKSNEQQATEPMNKYSSVNLPRCSNFLETEYSRFLTPSYEIRGLNVRDHNFEYPLHDPQCHIFENFAVNTQLQAKDNYRAKWQIPINDPSYLPNNKLGTPQIPNIDESKYGIFNPKR